MYEAAGFLHQIIRYNRNGYNEGVEKALCMSFFYSASINNCLIVTCLR